ncbi:hypothetical protein [Bradyrhizobium sp. BR 10289]|uniref:hypothetical protein n=1 Tax=Bradyrhizobium sp. BR 10289 TaxID=2749993 RepID=UPI001C64AA4C|nr:hypothetical protein [Bradyrhizobium sp. BR 10289]MBW7971546.1 hypothetical protein [Bradyrhizobium sp. BR 10289]
MLVSSMSMPSSDAQRLQNCRPGASAGQIESCDEEASRLANARTQTTMLSDGWRLVKTRDTTSNAEIVSVMHVADISKSDINLAGLSLRCGQDGLQAVLILLQPLPRASRPSVVMKAEAKTFEVEAAVVQGGEALLLPGLESKLANGAWQAAGELSVEIAASPSPIQGVIPIRGLAGALRSLPPNCLTK